MNTNDLLTLPQFSLSQQEKERYLTTELARLTELHRQNCPPYRRLLDVSGYADARRMVDIPFLPVGLFKSHDLVSIPPQDVFKVLTSSGTTGQQVSRVKLDQATAQRQTRALAAIMTAVLGPSRLPMLIVDSPTTVRDRRSFSARGAAVLGMMTFGRRHTYLLRDDMSLDEEALRQFLAAHGDAPFLVFGFTFMVWQHLTRPAHARQYDLSNGVLVHSGGWKKLADQAVGNATFRAEILRSTGLTRIHNFYGMVEQVGSVFVEGDDGYLHTPNFADVIIRDPHTWSEAPNGEAGIVQVMSTLPTSYPGHSLITEDLGIVHDVVDPRSGWSGKRFEILGRVPRAELRGCSDTQAVGAA